MSLTFSDIAPDELSSFDTDLEAFVPTGETIRIPANEWVEHTEKLTIGSKDFTLDTRVQFLDPRLSSISLRKTNATTGTYAGGEARIDFNGVVVSKRILEVLFNDKWINAEDFCFGALRAMNPGLDISTEKLRSLYRGYGFDMTAESPMYLQHLGASAEAYTEIAHKFLELGATENTRDIRNQGLKVEVMSSYRHQGAGLAIHELEISHADRSRSVANPNSGFIGFMDATYNVFLEITKIHALRSKLKRVLAEDPDNETAKMANHKIAEMFSQTRLRRPFHNWGGLTAINELMAPGEDFDIDMVRYYSQQVPCGRMTVETASGPDTWSVWRTAGNPVETMRSEAPNPSPEADVSVEIAEMLSADNPM